MTFGSEHGEKPGFVTVLVAEDYRPLRELYGQILASDSIVRCIGHADTGQEALRLAQELLPDVLVMDISLPDASGLNLISTLKSTCPTISIVVLGDDDSEDYRVAALASGASAYLHKIRVREHLVPVVRSLAR